MTQLGHLSAEMTKHYSRIRRQPMDQAAATLEPNYPAAPARVDLVN
jgi:hypothetical protein